MIPRKWNRLCPMYVHIYTYYSNKSWYRITSLWNSFSKRLRDALSLSRVQTRILLPSTFCLRYQFFDTGLSTYKKAFLSRCFLLVVMNRYFERSSYFGLIYVYRELKIQNRPKQWSMKKPPFWFSLARLWVGTKGYLDLSSQMTKSILISNYLI